MSHEEVRKVGVSLRTLLASGLVVLTVPFMAAAMDREGMMRSRVPEDKLAEARALTNPLPDSTEVIQAGKILYEGKGGCVKCHGASGRGDGEAAATLDPPPRNFRHHGFWRHRSEGEIFWVIKNGIPGTAMVAFGSQLAEEEIWSIIRYERTFAGRHGPGHRGGRGPRGGMGMGLDGHSAPP